MVGNGEDKGSGNGDSKGDDGVYDNNSNSGGGGSDDAAATQLRPRWTVPRQRDNNDGDSNNRNCDGRRDGSDGNSGNANGRRDRNSNGVSAT